MLLSIASPVASSSSSSRITQVCLSRRLYHAVVPQRSILMATGRDTRKLLQNLTTNDVNKIDRVQFTGFLTPQGRMIATAFIYTIESQDHGEGLLIDLDTNLVGAVQDCIRRFKLRSKVNVKDVTQEMAVMAHWDGDSISPDAVAAGADIRTPEMGYRSVVHRNGSLALENGDPQSAKAYTVHRVMQGVAESSEELAGLPLEANLDIMHGVDFRKGCYLGQELTARTHHTGVVRKRIVPVSIYDRVSQPPKALQHDSQIPSLLQSIPLGSDVRAEPIEQRAQTDGEDGAQRRPSRGRSAGKLLSHVGNIGLAMLRLEQISRWNKDTLLRIPIVGGATDTATAVYVRPWIPHWWPADLVEK